LNTGEVAIFDFAIKCTLLLEFMQMGIGYSTFPKIFTLWKNSNFKGSTPEVNRYYNGNMALNLMAVPVFVIAIPILLPVLLQIKIFCFISIFGFIKFRLFD